MHQPKINHWIVVKCILRYLKSTLIHGLFLSKHTNLTIHAYFDVNWAGYLDNRRSMGEYCIFLGQHHVSWSSKNKKNKQIVARSSPKAEYKSLANTTLEIIWVQTLIWELGFSLFLAPIIWYDNLRATLLTTNPIYHCRTKHMDIDFHFLCDRVVSKTLSVEFCISEDQLAYIFTKPLVSTHFSHL